MPSTLPSVLFFCVLLSLPRLTVFPTLRYLPEHLLVVVNLMVYIQSFACRQHFQDFSLCCGSFVTCQSGGVSYVMLNVMSWKQLQA